MSPLNGLVGYALRRAQLAIFADFNQTLASLKLRQLGRTQIQRGERLIEIGEYRQLCPAQGIADETVERRHFHDSDCASRTSLVPGRIAPSPALHRLTPT